MRVVILRQPLVIALLVAQDMFDLGFEAPFRYIDGHDQAPFRKSILPVTAAEMSEVRFFPQEIDEMVVFGYEGVDRGGLAIEMVGDGALFGEGWKSQYIVLDEELCYPLLTCRTLHTDSTYISES